MLLCSRVAHGYTVEGLSNAVRLVMHRSSIWATGPRVPRVHDFRHAFAVAALKRWYEDGCEVQSELPSSRCTWGTSPLPPPPTIFASCRPRSRSPASASPTRAVISSMEVPYEPLKFHGLGRDLVSFFEDFLPAQRGLSSHTVRSYRDALLLFLRFSAADLRRTVDRLDISDLTVERVTRFLASLEAERCNGIATRNARLGAIHVFARYLASRRPEYLGILQRTIGMPFKRGAIEAPIEYLDRTELDALLKSIDRSRHLGRRDYALFAFMFNTGARVQEVLDVRVSDVRLEAPA